MAYSRDPNLAFYTLDSNHTNESSQCYWGPPLARNHKQPITYHNITLAHSTLLEGHFASQKISVLQVDWIKGIAKTFDDSDDALNGVCSFEGSWTCPPTERETLNQYVNETLQFIQRGHSLLDPQCVCKHKINSNRCKKLGITPSYERPDWCSLNMGPREISASELSKELAVHNIYEMPGPAFIFALESLCNIRVSKEDNTLYFSPLGIILGATVRNREELLLKLKSNPLPFEQPKSSSYAGMEEDLEELVQENLVLIIKRNPMTLYYLRPEAGVGTQVDTDIQNLWESAANKIPKLSTTVKRSKHSHQPFP